MCVRERKGGGGVVSLKKNLRGRREVVRSCLESYHKSVLSGEKGWGGRERKEYFI